MGGVHGVYPLSCLHGSRRIRRRLASVPVATGPSLLQLGGN